MNSYVMEVFQWNSYVKIVYQSNSFVKIISLSMNSYVKLIVSNLYM